MGEWIQFVSGNSVYVDLANLELLGSGSCRDTYALSESLVIKLTKRRPDDNRNEFIAYCNRLADDRGLNEVAAVLDISVCGSYLIQERINGETLHDLDEDVTEYSIDEWCRDIHDENFMIEARTGRLICIDMGWEEQSDYDSGEIIDYYNEVYLRHLSRVPTHARFIPLPTQQSV